MSRTVFLMKLGLTTEDEAFRQEVRAFLYADLKPEWVNRVRSGFPVPKEDKRAWNAILAQKGWAAPHWPVEHGGPGWSPLRQHIFESEANDAYAPPLSWFGIRLVGPVLYTFGSRAHRERFLPPILDGSEFWCQGFSEPGAGSDLASLRARAERKGDRFVVNGHKIWTTEAHHADWGFFLVRTDPEAKPQKGISFLLIDMRSPGVIVRPIRDLAGSHHFNEVFLSDVEVPADHIVGEENMGWSYAKFLLTNERTASAEVYWSKRELAKARAIAGRTLLAGRPAIEHPMIARRFARLEIEIRALEWTVLRALCGDDAEHPDAIASALKVRGSELQQKVTTLLVDILQDRALRDLREGDLETSPLPSDETGAMALHLYGRSYTIYGGAREIQKDLVARAAFGF